MDIHKYLIYVITIRLNETISPIFWVKKAYIEARKGNPKVAQVALICLGFLPEILICPVCSVCNIVCPCYSQGIEIAHRYENHNLMINWMGNTMCNRFTQNYSKIWLNELMNEYISSSNSQSVQLYLFAKENKGD